MLNENEVTQLLLRFTRRQRQVVVLTSEGLTNAEIGQRLYIESCVVASHLSNVYDQLAGYDIFANRPPNRRSLIRIFSPFFERHPELIPPLDD